MYFQETSPFHLLHHSQYHFWLLFPFTIHVEWLGWTLDDLISTPGCSRDFSAQLHSDSLSYSSTLLFNVYDRLFHQRQEGQVLKLNTHIHIVLLIRLFLLSHFFILFFYILYDCIYCFMFCMLLFLFVQTSLMYYCYMCYVLGILFHYVVLCIVCV